MRSRDGLGFGFASFVSFVCVKFVSFVGFLV